MFWSFRYSTLPSKSSIFFSSLISKTGILIISSFQSSNSTGITSISPLLMRQYWPWSVPHLVTGSEHIHRTQRKIYTRTTEEGNLCVGLANTNCYALLSWLSKFFGYFLPRNSLKQMKTPPEQQQMCRAAQGRTSPFGRKLTMNVRHM